MKTFNLKQDYQKMKLVVESDSLEGLFSAALEGMNNILNKDYKKELNGRAITHEIATASVDMSSLLAIFISEVLAVSKSGTVIFHHIDLLEIEDNKLHIHLIGSPVSKFFQDIKAVSDNEVVVRKNQKNNYEATIVFEI